jgi:hypothetical protein
MMQQNENIRTGDFRYLNLLLPPFNFPPPVRQIDEKFPDEQAEFYGKKLGLWRLAGLLAGRFAFTSERRN